MNNFFIYLNKIISLLIKYLSERSFNIPIDIKYKLIPLKYFIKSQEEIILF